MPKKDKDKTVKNVAEQAAAQQEINARIQAEAAGQDGKKDKQDPAKMTVYDYEQRYSKRENVKGARLLLGFAVGVIGVFLFVVLLLLFFKVYDINEYAGYGVGAVCLLVYIFIFIVPLVKIFRTGYFVTNVNAYTARKAQRHNKKLRREIAKKIIDFTAKVEGVGWYDSETVGKLAISLNAGDNEGIKNNLTALYNGSVKKTAKQLIFKASVKSAMYSALSQTSKIDSALVVLVNMQLIKDLVYL